MLKIQKPVNRYLILLCVFLSSIISMASAQKPYFQIQSVDTGKMIKVKKGNFLQCIQKNSFGQESFVFGEVITVRHDGVMLRENPFIRGSGGFVFYDDIVNIDKIKVLKRSLLSACIGGCVLGQLTVIHQIPTGIVRPLSGVATFFVMSRALKVKKKSLYKNRVPEVVILIPPAVGIQSDRYFEPSSSLNQPE